MKVCGAGWESGRPAGGQSARQDAQVGDPCLPQHAKLMGVERLELSAHTCGCYTPFTASKNRPLPLQHARPALQESFVGCPHAKHL